MAIQLATRGASGTVITGTDRSVISYKYKLFGNIKVYRTSIDVRDIDTRSEEGT